MFRIITVISGKNQGEKICFSAGKLTYKSCETGFLSDNMQDIEKLTDTGIYTIDGRSVFVMNYGSRPRLIILGAGHVARSLVRVMQIQNFDICVIDDRKEFIEEISEYGNIDVICDDFVRAIETISDDGENYYVCMTRGHKYDMDCLKAVLNKKRAYVGMMSSKKRALMAKEELIGLGYESEAVDLIHSPIGLSIGARTPEEIAVSIAAELIQCKNSRNICDEAPEGITEYLKKLYIYGDDDLREKAVLCTIVEKHGSTPRNVGTQMLVRNSGIIGTIGGGSTEAEIINICIEMIRNEMNSMVQDFSIANADIADGGAMCGGMIKVYCEMLTV